MMRTSIARTSKTAGEVIDERVQGGNGAMWDERPHEKGCTYCRKLVVAAGDVAGWWSSLAWGSSRVPSSSSSSSGWEMAQTSLKGWALYESEKSGISGTLVQCSLSLLQLL